MRAWASKKPDKFSSALEPEEACGGTETDVELEDIFPEVFEPVNQSVPCEDIKRDDV